VARLFSDKLSAHSAHQLDGARSAPLRATELAIEAPLPRGRWFWTVTSHGRGVDAADTVWQFATRSGRVERNRSWASRSDFDNDGFDDVLIEGSRDRRPTFWLLFGARTLEETRLRRIASPPGWEWRWSAARYSGVARVGDLDGDGSAELALIVQRSPPSHQLDASQRQPSESGYAVLYSRQDYDPRGATMFLHGHHDLLGGIAPAGDADGDGYGDIVVSDFDAPQVARVCFGGRAGLDLQRCLPLSLPDDPPLLRFVGIGDADGDGADEFVVESSRGPSFSTVRVRRDAAVFDVSPFARFEQAQSVALSGALDPLGNGAPELAIFSGTSRVVYLVSPDTGVQRAPIVASSSYHEAFSVVSARGESAADELVELRYSGSETRDVVTLSPTRGATTIGRVDGTSVVFADLDGDDQLELLSTVGAPEPCAIYVYDGRALQRRRVIEARAAGEHCWLGDS
jgi:hypothetical protein